MEIKYAGPKAIITRYGVNFDNNLDDKFIYLNIVIQLINAIDQEHLPDKVYSYDQATKRLSNKEITDYVLDSYPNSKNVFELAEKEAELSYAKEVNTAQNYPSITQAEKDVWLNNLKLMKDYNTQRIFNKQIYDMLIEKFTNTIKERQIKQITTPMYPNFMHVLNSTHDKLSIKKPSVRSKLEILANDKNNIYIKFSILF